LIDSKHGKPNVHFAQDVAKDISVQSAVKPSMTSSTSGSFLSPFQVVIYYDIR